MAHINYGELTEIELAQRANGGDINAHYHLARQVENSIRHDMPPDEKARRYSRAHKHFMSAARGGLVEAAVYITNHHVANGQIELATMFALQFLTLHPDKGLSEFAEIISRPNMSKSGLAKLMLGTAARALTVESRTNAQASVVPVLEDVINISTPLAPGARPG